MKRLAAVIVCLAILVSAVVILNRPSVVRAHGSLSRIAFTPTQPGTISDCLTRWGGSTWSPEDEKHYRLKLDIVLQEEATNGTWVQIEHTQAVFADDDSVTKRVTGRYGGGKFRSVSWGTAYHRDGSQHGPTSKDYSGNGITLC